MRRLVFVAAVFGLTAGIARASDDLWCAGQHVKKVTAALAAYPKIIGTEPVEVRITTCGGGISPIGERIPKWSCLFQRWKWRGDSGVMMLILAYEKVDGEWRLASAKGCPPGSDECSTLPIPPCDSEF